MCLILDNIRRLKKKIDRLQLKVECFSTYKGIKYEADHVQSSSDLHAGENLIINHIMDEQHLERLKQEQKDLISQVDMKQFTDRQQEFIRLFYFQGMTQTQCCKFLKIKISAVCRLKKRVVYKMLAEEIQQRS